MLEVAAPSGPKQEGKTRSVNPQTYHYRMAEASYLKRSELERGTGEKLTESPGSLSIRRLSSGNHYRDRG